ncbi:MAG: hypothetical protein RBS43_11465 [Candidatus Cloacimonas sp.]|nr:hypothetical protein [Candidatus Cloacimonas sp.]
MKTAKPSVIPAEELVRKLQNLLSYPRRSLCENSKTFCHTRGGGYPARENPIRDETIITLQFKHIYAVLTELRNGLDSCLRRYDKTFLHKLLRRNDKRFHTSSKVEIHPS